MTDSRFEQIVLQYEKLVFTVCFQMLRDYHEAQNIAQETFLSAYRHIDKCKEDEYKPWLIRIAVNKAKDHLKSAYIRRVAADFDEAAGDGQPRAGPVSADIEDEYISREGVKAIRSAVTSLREPYRFVSVMYFLEDNSPEEIAKKLSRPLKTVQTQLYRAKLILREALREADKLEK